MVHGQRQLLEIVPAGRRRRSFPRGLNGGQQQRDQDPDDGDDDQQFDERETVSTWHEAVTPLCAGWFQARYPRCRSRVATFAGNGVGSETQPTARYPRRCLVAHARASYDGPVSGSVFAYSSRRQRVPRGVFSPATAKPASRRRGTRQKEASDCECSHHAPRDDMSSRRSVTTTLVARVIVSPVPNEFADGNMRWTLRTQIFVPFGALTLIVLVLVSAINAFLAARHATRQIEQQIERIAGSMQTSSYPLTDSILQQTRALSGAEFIVTDASGRVTASSFESPAVLESDFSPAIRSRGAEPLPTVAVLGQRYFHSMVRTERGQRRTPQELHILYPERAWHEARWQATYPPLVVGARGAGGRVRAGHHDRRSPEPADRAIAGPGRPHRQRAFRTAPAATAQGRVGGPDPGGQFAGRRPGRLQPGHPAQRAIGLDGAVERRPGPPPAERRDRRRSWPCNCTNAAAAPRIRKAWRWPTASCG